MICKKMNSKIKEKKLLRKHWIKLALQICKLYLKKEIKQTDLTNLSYNKMQVYTILHGLTI